MSKMLDELRTRIKTLIDETDTTQSKIATSTNIEQASLSRFLKGGILRGDNIISLLEYLNATIVYNSENQVECVQLDAQLKAAYAKLKQENHDLSIELQTLYKVLNINKSQAQPELQEDLKNKAAS